jgi:hypothetical protein
LSVKLLVGHFGQEELRQLGPIRAGHFGRVGDVLDNGPQFPGQVIV